MPQIKAKPAFHQEQVQIVDHAHRRPLHLSTFVLKCFKTSVESCSARAIDRRDSWECIALYAVDDGYIDFADELGTFIEASLRRGC